MLDKYLLYSLLYDKSPWALLNFIVHAYEIPKRKVDIGLSKSQKKKLRELVNTYFEEHGLDADALVRVRDAYVHRGIAIGDLYIMVDRLPVAAVMTYVKHFGLDVEVSVIIDKKQETLLYLCSICGIFGYVSFNVSELGGRFVPWKED